MFALSFIRLVGFLLFLLILIFLSHNLLYAKEDNKKIRIGIFQNAPIVYQDDEGEPKGIYVDLINEIARLENWKLSYIFDSWSNCLEKLKLGEIDLMTSIAFTSERDKQMDFSTENVLTMWGQVYVRPDSIIQNILDINGKTIAILKGGINGINFRKLCEKFGVEGQFIEKDTYEEVIHLTEDGMVDAGVINNVRGYQFEKEYRVKRSPILFNPFKLLFATPEGKHKEILSVIDMHLIRWKKNEKSVYYQTLDHWYGAGFHYKKIIPNWVWILLLGGSGLTFFLFAWLKILNKQVKARTKDLEESKEQFSLFMDFFPGAAFIKDEDSRTIYANKYLIDNFGLEKWLGKTVLELFPKETAAKMIEDDRKSLSTGYHKLTETVPDVKGMPHIFETHKFAIRKPNAPPLLGGIAIDITKRILAEEKLARHLESLEEHVEERTDELTKANQQLNQQIEERKKTGNKLKKRTDELQILIDTIPGREVRMAELKKVIEKLRAQLKEAGMEPVADDPLKETGKDYT